MPEGEKGPIPRRWLVRVCCAVKDGDTGGVCGWGCRARRSLRRPWRLRTAKGVKAGQEEAAG